ncbi:MAG TPA: glycosyltransferase family 87 protein [Candidatus Omnitrophota bacterium]|nr:glycosyltransferase family 87 protein [Candidatus Omnitrophota bacterium]
MIRLMAAILLVAAMVRGLAWALPGPDLMDFGSFFASGEAAAKGGNPYGIHPRTFHVVLPGFESWNPNLNPPVSLPAFQLFALIDPHEGFRLWWAASFIGYAGGVLLLLRRYRRPMAALLAFGLAGFWDTLALGQVYVPLVLAAIFAWLLLEKGRGIEAGLLIGLLVAVKPNFLVWPALLLLAGHHRPAVVAIAVAAVSSAVPVFLYGPEIYARWVEAVTADANRAAFLTNASLTGLGARLGSREAGLVAGAVLLAGLAWWAWRRRPDAMAASALGLVGALLASPIAWVHYTLFLLPVFFVLPASPLLVVSAALLVLPVPWVIELLDASAVAKATFGSVYAWAVILCLAALLMRLLPHRNTKSGQMR